MKMSQSVLDTLQAEEASGMAKTEMDVDNSLGDEERRQLSEKMKEHMVCSMLFYGQSRVSDKVEALRIILR